MDIAFAARDATAADYPHLVRLFPELAVPEPVPTPAAWESEMAPKTFFLERAGVVVAYAWIRVLGELCYVVNVVVDPEHRGLGVGRALMNAIAARARAQGCTRWALNVKVDNTPAVRLYERCGLREAYASTALRLAWSVVDRLPREARAVHARLIDPSEDAELERAFDLPALRLTSLRERPDRVLLRLVDPESPGEAKVGLAVFVREHPGAVVFRVARPTLAGPLLDAMRPHAPPEHEYVRVLVEAHPALDRTLRDQGASVEFELMHMAGPLPDAG